MGIGTFRSHNKAGESWTFQTLVSSASTFDPAVSFLGGGTKRVSWDVGEPYYYGGNNLNYTFSDSGDVKTVTIRTYYGGISDIYAVNFYSDGICGHVNLSGFTNLGGELRLDENPRIYLVTNPISPNSMFYGLNGLPLDPSDISGTLDLTTLTGITGFSLAHMPKVTQIINPTSNLNVNYYVASNNGSYSVTGLTGTLDLSTLTGLGGFFTVQTNPLLTQIINPISNNSFYYYNTVNTGIYDLDLSTLTGLGGQIFLNNCPSLSAITFPTNYQNISWVTTSNCNLIGTLDVSGLFGLGGNFWTEANPNLINISFPLLTAGTLNSIFAYSCNLDYINFLPLSGATFDPSGYYNSILLQDNGMLTTDVNHILVDFEYMASSNPTKWSGVTLNIGGTNSAPDSSSGGYNGISAINSLTGNPYSWVITTS